MPMQSKSIVLLFKMKTKKKYGGVVVPLVTPLTGQFTLDHAAVEKIFDYTGQYECQPFILGTTGEATSLPFAVKKDYIRKAASLKKKYQVLYAGVGSNCVQDAIDLAKFSFEEGVDVVVATLPSYYHLTYHEMKSYFKQLADAIPGPLMIYNIPSTTHMSIPLNVIDELSQHPKIVGVKDSERSEERMKDSLSLWSQRPDFCYFLGWVMKSVDALAAGADGLVPSSANLDPKLYQGIWLNGGNDPYQQQYSDSLGELYQAGRTLGQSLAALKVLMKQLELCDTWMMPPLEKLFTPEEKKLIRKFSAKYK
jgi:dihydrodipicolinate synthase/N-acetylneuraminate lyase